MADARGVGCISRLKASTFFGDASIRAADRLRLVVSVSLRPSCTGGGGGWVQVAGRSGGALTWADASIRAADSCTSVSASLRRISSNRCSVEAACHQGGKRGRGFSGGSFRPQWAEGGCIP